MFSSAGLTQTTDTGQIALSGLTWVNTTSTNYGYEIWKFPDALQSTTPIFIKVEYMNSTGSATVVGMKVSVASSTDGAGTLTTTAGPVFGPYGGTGLGAFAASRVSYACYTDGTFALIMAKDAQSAALTTNNTLLSLVIDRARNNSGVAQSGGYLVSAQSANGFVQHRHMYGTNTTAVTLGPPFLMPNFAAVSSIEGTNVNAVRVYMQTPGIHPSLGFLAYYNNEIADLTPQTFTILGSSHTYLPVARAFNNWNGGFTTSIDVCGMIRWE